MAPGRLIVSGDTSFKTIMPHSKWLILSKICSIVPRPFLLPSWALVEVGIYLKYAILNYFYDVINTKGHLTLTQLSLISFFT